MPVETPKARLKKLKEELAYAETQVRVDVQSLKLALKKRNRLLERIRLLEERIAENSKKSERSGKK